MTHRPRLRFLLPIALTFVFPFIAAAQDPKQAEAQRVADHTICVDGQLDEQVWESAVPLTDFIQKEPIEGAPPSQPMEVRFAYDADALYVGFRVWSGDVAALQAPLGRRDLADQAEHVIVSLDTYRDRRTAYTFGVTASGVRIDRFHIEDQQEGADVGFDPVWEARTVINSSGWTAELWIPFSQLRFNDSPKQTWGLNVGRYTPTLNEEDYWVPIPRTVTAWASRFGDLTGLNDVRPARRLELLPYAATSAGFNDEIDSNNPFADGRTFGGRVGLDMRLGIGSSLTLNVAVNPDFGQVEADPAEVNLTAFETIFPEKRPFFTEGASLMNLGVRSGANLFNSRRIGARPIGPATGEYVSYPKLIRGGTRERVEYGSAGTTIERDQTGEWVIMAGGTPFRLTNPDFAVRSLRSNVVLRWEWQPGSTLYVVWQQDHERRDAIAARAGLDDLFGAFAIPGRTILAVKSSFWLPIR